MYNLHYPTIKAWGIPCLSSYLSITKVLITNSHKEDLATIFISPSLRNQSNDFVIWCAMMWYAMYPSVNDSDTHWGAYVYMMSSSGHQTSPPRMGWVPQAYLSTSYFAWSWVPLGISTHAMHILAAKSLPTTCYYIHTIPYSPLIYHFPVSYASILPIYYLHAI